MSLLILLHTTATLFMTGLIWFVQAVHYPLFAKVGASGFAEYETMHTRRTTWVVAPFMLVEALTAIYLVFEGPSHVSPILPWVGLSLLLMIWISTVLLQIPQHQVLARRFDRDAHSKLVLTNWIRTVAWSLRSIIVLIIFSKGVVGAS